MGRIFYTAQFTGSMREFSSLARPVWDKMYQKTLVLDFFSPEYLEAVQGSSLEFYGLATYYRKEPVCLCLNLGYRAEIFSRSLRVVLISWFSVVEETASSMSQALRLTGVVQMCMDMVETARMKKYDLVLGIVDAQSAMLNAARIKSKGVYPVISKPLVAMASIESKKMLEKMYLNRHEELLLRLLQREWKDEKPPDHDGGDDQGKGSGEVEEIPLSRQRLYEDILNEKAYDLKIINEFSQYCPPGADFSRFFRLFEIRRKGERIGIVRILDLAIRGGELIPSVVIEQVWTRPFHLRTCLALFISAMKREGKKMIMSIFPLFRLSERMALLTLGFLPDYSRPVRVVSIALDAKIGECLPQIKSFSLPFR
ncbi:MAG: hypothetical protein AB1847_07220 [bacterium]